MEYKIMGAGPAGLSAAIKLAQQGFKVDIFERTGMVGGHIGNNIQAIRSYGKDKGIIERFRQDGLELNKAHPIHEITKYSSTARAETIFSKNEPIFYSFKRGVEHDSLEVQLAEQARSIGVNILLGKKTKILDVNIVAGGSKFNPVGMGYGALFEGNFNPKRILFFMATKHFRHGYGYLVPFGKKQATLAITSFKSTDFAHLETNFNKFLKENNILKQALLGAVLVNRFSGYGHFNIPETAVHKYKYFIGGAAGFVDPARGFGIKYALLSGMLAAKAITSKADYDSLWKEEFRQELIEGFNRRNLLNKLFLADYEKFVEEKRISIENYEKVPSSLGNLLLNLNGSVKLSQWKKQFRFEDVFGM